MSAARFPAALPQQDHRMERHLQKNATAQPSPPSRCMERVQIHPPTLSKSNRHAQCRRCYITLYRAQSSVPSQSNYLHCGAVQPHVAGSGCAVQHRLRLLGRRFRLQQCIVDAGAPCLIPDVAGRANPLDNRRCIGEVGAHVVVVRVIRRFTLHRCQDVAPAFSILHQCIEQSGWDHHER